MPNPNKVRRQVAASIRRQREAPCVGCGHNTVRVDYLGRPHHPENGCPDKPAPATSKTARKQRRKSKS